MNNLKVNDLFCGAGGMGLGFKQAGFEIAGAWDFDKYAVQSYKHNVGDHVKQDDILEMSWMDIPKADVWTFGFPCVAYSIAGKKLGMLFECIVCEHQEMFDGELIIDRNTKCTKCNGESKPKDERGILLFEVMRLLKETNENDFDSLPSIIMAENVKGLKKYLGTLEHEYKKRGYKMYQVLYNSKFWGVPQNRERYFVVGVHESIEKEFSFPKQQEKNIPKLSTVLEEVVDEKYFISNEKAKVVIEEAKKKVKLENVHACLTPDRPKRQNGPRAKADQLEMFTLTAQDRHGVIQMLGMLDIKGKEQIRRVYGIGGISPTLTAVQGGGHHAKILVKFRVRKLTPREYARLQGFPESFEIIVSDSQAYKQFGNAVTVNVAQSVAEQIKSFLLSIKEPGKSEKK